MPREGIFTRLVRGRGILCRTMGKNVLILQGHPDAHAGHLGSALDAAYAEGAAASGHSVKRIAVAECEFDLVRSANEWMNGTPTLSIVEAQQAIEWADHLVVFYPLWLGDVPALLKAFLEQVARPGFAFSIAKKGGIGKPRLRGKSARIVVTMGMPAFVYKWYFGAHSLRSLERNVLKFVGIAPVRSAIFGSVEAAGDRKRRRWLKEMRRLGERAA